MGMGRVLPAPFLAFDLGTLQPFCNAVRLECADLDQFIKSLFSEIFAVWKQTAVTRWYC